MDSLVLKGTDSHKRTERSHEDEAVSSALRFLHDLFGEAYARSFAIRLWDGSTVPASEKPRFVLRVNAPFALRAAFMPPLDLKPGEAFANGWLDVDGDVEAAVDLFMHALDSVGPATLPRLLPQLLRLPKAPAGNAEALAAQLRGRVHSRRRDTAAIAHHYDLPLEFFRAFLDENLVYSCGYWDDGVETLAKAQEAKIDYILRKVRLRPGERLLDVGCGWGSLVLRAADRFAAKAHGITLSKLQYDEARRRIAALGLGDRCRVELCDYRELGGRTFDKIVSVGMVEHVGFAQLPSYFQAAWNALRPGGLFLNHGIGEQSPGRRGGKVTGFIARHIFPDGDIVAIGEVLRAAERIGFEVRDVENLREHYARTLRAWVSNLTRNRTRAVAASDDATYRAWLLYLAGSAQGFASGRLGVFQSLLARASRDGRTAHPPTRRDLY